MAQTIRRRPLAEDVLLRTQIIPCEIYGEQNDAWMRFSPSTLDFPCRYNSTDAPYLVSDTY
jgi:hypothetical protein